MKNATTVTKKRTDLLEAIRAFARTELAPHAGRRDREGRYPEETIRAMAERGWLGFMVPESAGGLGRSAVEYVAAMEEIAAADASISVIFSVHVSLATNLLIQRGSEGLKGKYLADMASGRKLGCYCLSEPSSGSDAGTMRAVARRDGDQYVLSGTKNFISSGDAADLAIVFASTDPEKGKKGISCFLVETATPGCTPGKAERKLGLHASRTTEIHLEDCRIPAENRIGEEGEGFTIALERLDDGRIGIAAQALGIARCAYEHARAWALEEQAPGYRPFDAQRVQFILADMATRLDAARLLVRRAAEAKDAGTGRFSRESATAKLFASETSSLVTLEAIRLMGEAGLTADHPVERCLRDTRVTRIYEGTSEIQRLVIAREIAARA